MRQNHISNENYSFDARQTMLMIAQTAFLFSFFAFPTKILFHNLTISINLNFSGLDVVAILEYLGLSNISSSISNNITTGASTFVIAYAIHKVFAPVRISITLFSTPFIVRYLRQRGILKSKKSN